MTSPVGSSASLGLGSLAAPSTTSSSTAQPIASINGIASGIQWQGMVDQIMQVEQATELDPVTAKENAAQAQAAAWTAFQGVLGKFRDAANALAASSSFDVFTATAGKSPTTSRDLISATATTGAATGTFSAEVLQLARSEKIGGNVVADSTVPLNVSGQFALNGVTIAVVATDSLAAIRDKINAADAGTTPSGVTATILAAGSGSQLVLTSDATGAAGIQTVDDAAGTLRTLGFADATTVANIAASGATQTNRMWSGTGSIGSLFTLPMPAASTIKVGGQVISVDLSTDSLQSIANKINTALGSTTAASVVSETVGSRTAYRLQTSATVETDSSVNAAASAQILATLGFTNEGRSGTVASVGSANLFNDSSTAAAVTTTTALSNLQIGTQSLGLVAGDVITINGTRGDGTAVSTSYTVAGGSTMQDVLNAINSATTGFGSGTRTATASLSGGRIVLTDNTAGASQLGVSIAVNRAAGGTVSLGAFSTATGGSAGRSRELTTGADAQVRIDGQTITRASNTISDAITGVTLNLLGAEPGTVVNVNVAHDVSTITQTIQSFVTAYNNVRTWVNQNTAANGPLANDTTAMGMAETLTTALLNNVVGTTGTLTTAAIAGLQHDKTGVLSLDTTTFQNFATTNFSGLRQLFTMSGTPSDNSVSFITAGPNAKPTATPYPIVITQASTLGSATGAIWSTYATTGTPDTMTLTDTNTGYSGSVSIANGDTIDTTIAHLNAMFSAQKMRLTATKTVDSRVQITALDYGTTGGFTVAYTPGTGGNGTAALGIAAGPYTGLDVAGTINGVAGTGRGQYLTGATGDASEGIIIRYTGTTARSAGTLAFSVGVGGTLASLATGLAADNTGAAALAAANATQSATDLASNIADIQSRLDQRRAQLTQQFIAMETALAQSQNLGNALASQISALQAPSK